MRIHTFILTLISFAVSTSAQVISLDSCRSLALANNKQLRIQSEHIKGAHYERKAALSVYLPAIDFSGGYLYNQKDISIFGSDQLLPTKTFNVETGKYEFNLVSNPTTGEPIKSPDGQYIPSTVALIPKESMTFDTHNIFFGALTITQPLFMGGKIIAMNRLAHFAEALAKTSRNIETENIIYAVDAAYWQVVSLKAKHKLATSYVNLLDTLFRNVNLMHQEGVATKNDVLSVGVKLNEAQVDLTKVENGLSLSRMALAQICGLPIDSPMLLDDENLTPPISNTPIANEYNMADVFAQRNDIKALKLGVKIYEQKQRIAQSSMMPNLAVIGSYMFSNPNMYNGFQNKFAGAFSIGATLTIPIWHWGGNYNKYQAAKTNVTISRLSLMDAQEKIELQVNQASYKAREAIKTYHMTTKNLANAKENLRMAQIGFNEGVLSIDNVMEAQTAWLKANSENIDAQIDVYLCNVYLSKTLGTLIDN